MKGSLEVIERVFSDDIATGQITELKESSKRPDNIGRDEPLNSIQVHLQVEISISVDTVFATYLHQGLGIVSSPLSEIPSLFEPA